MPSSGLGVVIKRKRLALGLTQDQLAKRAGVTKNYVTMVERGARQSASILVRILLAEALGLAPTEVLTTKEADGLRSVNRALSLEGAEAIVWQLERCLEDPRQTPTTSKFGAAIALRKVRRAHPDRRTVLDSLRAQLDGLYRRRAQRLE